MIDIKILPRPEGLARDLLKDKEAARKAIKATVGDLRSRGPAQVSKAVRGVYAIKAADINPNQGGRRLAGGMHVQARGESVDDFTLVYTGSPMTPTHFGMKPGAPPWRQAVHHKGDYPQRCAQDNRALGSQGEGPWPLRSALRLAVLPGVRQWRLDATHAAPRRQAQGLPHRVGAPDGGQR